METMYGFEGKAFIMAHVRQRECLKDSGQLDLSHLQDYDILGSVGKVSNPRPESYTYWENHPTWYIAAELPASLCPKNATGVSAEQELC